MIATSLIANLNRQLGERLGLVASGTLPRFAWKHSTEIPMLAERLGNRWLLTEWRRLSMSPDEWTRISGGRFPYPSAGCYHPYPETALPPGMEPSQHLTEKAIKQFARQMDTTLANQMLAVNDELAEDHGYRPDGHGGYERIPVAEDQSKDRKEWVDFVQESGEAFCDPLVGKTAFPQFMGRKASEGFVGI